MKLIVCGMILTGCSVSPKSLEEDRYLENFTNWIRVNRSDQKEFLVMPFTACTTCHQQMIKLIQDGYTRLPEGRTVVLVVTSMNDLFPIEGYVDNEHLMVYPPGQLDEPIVDMLPRLYTPCQENYCMTTLSVKDFEEELRAMNNVLRDAEMVQQNATEVHIDDYVGMALPGNEDFIVKCDSGMVYHLDNAGMYAN